MSAKEKPRFRVWTWGLSSAHPPVASARLSLANAKNRLGAPLGVYARSKFELTQQQGQDRRFLTRRLR
eukprot:793285-Alexandrium_andersonii.AAC.1